VPSTGDPAGHREDGAIAVSEQTLTRERSRRLPRPGRRLFLFVLTGLLGAAAVAGGLAALHERQAGRILPGVSVAGVAVGGMTAAEARAALEASLADLSSGAVRIRSSVGSTSIAFADVGRTPDIDAMVTDATALGRGGTWFDETVAGLRLQLEPQAIPLRLGYDPARAAAAVRAFAARMALNPIDAAVIRSASGFAFSGSVDGRGIDAEATIAALDRVMRDPAARGGAVVEAPVTSVAPALTTEQAHEARLAAARVATALQVTYGKSTWQIKAWQIRPWITFDWVDGRYRPVIDATNIPAALTKIAKVVAKPVQDAEFLRDKSGRIVGSKADRAGRKLDVAASVAAITAALEKRIDAGSTAPAAKLAVVTVAPKVTTAEAAKKAPLMVMVGSWTTRYQSSAHNGFSANITVPTRYLNGTVVQPGAVFEWWAGLGGIGNVNFATGYKLGGAIVGGHSVEGKALAGGICAASTTLFNAALRGGFEIITRQPHWYYITRYPLGLDATVSQSQTMRFRNDTKFPILIRGFASPGYVRYEIWSVPNGRTVTFSRPRVSNVVPGQDSEVQAPDLPKGTSERIEWPVDGKDVVVTRTVRDASGRVINTDTFVSHYHRMIGINRIGIG
jgi:vancomycin resistance protein YoaR